MNITVIGSGNMGSAFVKQLTQTGHDVFITSRNAAKAQELAATYGATVVNADVAAKADVLVLATSFDDAVPALAALGDLSGKTVIDITNPLTADYMGLTIGHSTSAAEQIAAAYPGIKVVKAFNTLFAQVLGAGADFGNGQTASVFVAADDVAAKQTVQTLATGLGFNVVDAGPLKNARYLEPLAGLNIYFGYGAGLGTNIAPTWLHKA
ncbi:NAD(P)-binding domain-containing protein [uncultured Tolumonas sp.]|uniref:NADPH-dependent F420 reductase n=1 Tax=uncultured Tolumonas sp. TaxID=263765 RepID=UPI00292D972E|nr:NAD(P)-binding domain-containing protein [uncultured Tolumonas sp.]